MKDVITGTWADDVVSETQYSPWGETRSSSGTSLTNYKYTGQREEASFGLYFFNARWLDPSLGRFAQADTIIPQGQGVQAWDRYAYVNNSPLNYTDPSGHMRLREGDQNDRFSNRKSEEYEPKRERRDDSGGEDDDDDGGGGGKPLLMPTQDGSLCSSSFDDWCIYGGRVSTQDAVAISGMYEKYTNFTISLGAFGGAVALVNPVIGAAIAGIAAYEGYNANQTASFFQSAAQQADTNGGQVIVLFRYDDQANTVLEHSGNPVPSPVRSALVHLTLEGVLRWADDTVP